MGYLSTGTTIELTAKLTPEGRRRLITNDNNLVRYFNLGDSDSYYGAYTGLTMGQVPGMGGNNNGSDTNNGGIGYIVRSSLAYNASTDKKPVEASSISINTTFTPLDYKTINYSGGVITQNKISLSDTSTDSLTNLFQSFGLPISAQDFSTFTATTISSGGYQNTAYSGLAQTKILVIGIDNNEYGELIDGKSINMTLSNTASTFNIYSTYENTNRSLNLLDNDVYDTSTNLSVFGPNRVLLFSDDVVKPNGGDASKSWSTGYAANKPFSINGKETYNFTDNEGLSLTGDTPVGIAYLDSGFMVITEPTIVNDFVEGSASATGTSITFNHLRTTVSQSITCIAERGEFGASSNPTWTEGDTPRITELGLYDNSGVLIAIGKLNATYYKPIDDMVAFNVTINY